MSGNAISANPETIFSKFSGEHAPGPHTSPKNIFLAAAWLQKFLISTPPNPQNKILDRALDS